MVTSKGLFSGRPRGNPRDRSSAGKQHGDVSRSSKHQCGWFALWRGVLPTAVLNFEPRPHFTFSPLPSPYFWEGMGSLYGRGREGALPLPHATSNGGQLPRILLPTATLRATRTHGHFLQCSCSVTTCSPFAKQRCKFGPPREHGLQRKRPQLHVEHSQLQTQKNFMITLRARYGTEEGEYNRTLTWNSMTLTWGERSPQVLTYVDRSEVRCWQRCPFSRTVVAYHSLNELKATVRNGW